MPTWGEIREELDRTLAPTLQDWDVQTYAALASTVISLLAFALALHAQRGVSRLQKRQMLTATLRLRIKPGPDPHTYSICVKNLGKSNAWDIALTIRSQNSSAILAHANEERALTPGLIVTFVAKPGEDGAAPWHEWIAPFGVDVTYKDNLNLSGGDSRLWRSCYADSKWHKPKTTK